MKTSTMEFTKYNGQKVNIRGLTNDNDNCWLNSLAQLANYMDSVFFDSYYNGNSSSMDEILQLQTLTGIPDLTYGGPPSIVLYKIKEYLDFTVGTPSKPGQVCVTCGCDMTLADMHAGIFLDGDEHAVFYFRSEDGWVCVNDDQWYFMTPDPAHVLVFVPFDDEPMGQDSEIVFETCYARGGGQSKPQSGNMNQSGNSGSVVNNYYMQQYQNSIDTTLGDKPVIGGSGQGDTAGSATHNQNSTAPTGGGGMDWFGHLANLASNVLPAAIGLLADHKTEETTKLEDRIVVTRSGPTTKTTQSSVGVVMGYGGPSPQRTETLAAGLAVDVPSAQKFYDVGTWDWNTTHPAGRTMRYPLPASLRKGAFANLSRTYVLMQNGWEVVVSAQGTLSHGGMLLVAMVPELNFKDTSDSQPADYRQYTVYPHQMINPRTNTTAHIKVPYVGAFSMEDVNKHNTYTLVLVVISPLTTDGHTKTVVKVKVTVAPADVRVVGETPERQGLVPLASHVGYGGFKTTAPLSADPVCGNVYNPPRQDMPGRFTNFMQVAQVCPTFGKIGSGSTPYFLTTQDSDDLLSTIDVSFTSFEMSSTFLAGLAQFYAQYRGTINVHFTFTGPVKEKARFRVVFVPPGTTAPETAADASLFIHSDWDSGLNSEFVFPVPYVSPTPYTTTHGADADQATVNGWIQIYQLDATAANLAVTVAFSAGPDLEFRFPCEPVHYETTTDVGESGVGHDATPEQLGGVTNPSFRAHTDVSWVLDRYALAAKVNGYKDTLGAGLVLDPVALPETSLMGQLLRAATYYFADMELAVVPRGQPGDYAMVKWLPVGTPFDLRDNSLDGLALQGLDSTCSVGFTGSAGNGSAAVVAIPYNSPMRAIPTKYAGTTQYTHTTPARPGTANFGLVFVLGESGVSFRILYRLKRAELYCPRPLVYRIKNNIAFSKRQKYKLAGIHKETGISNRDLLLQAGDVETNPGPGVFSQFADLAASATQDFHNLTEGILELKNTLKGAGPWYKAFKYIWKLATLVVTAFRTQDPVVIAMQLADLGIEIFEAEVLVRGLAQKMSEQFQTPPPKFEFKYSELIERAEQIFEDFDDDAAPEKQFSMKRLNDIFSFLKHGEWLIKFFLAIRSWVRTWLKQEEAVMSYNDLVPKIIQKQLELKEPSTFAQAKNWLVRQKEILLTAGQKDLAQLCEVKAKEPVTGRPEPVVLVLRGKSGQGKSFMANILASAISRMLTGKPDSVWSCPPDPTYFDGYRGQSVVIMDDLGQNPDGKDFKYFAQMVSSTAFVVPMAALEDKGTLFTSPVIIATTNLSDAFTPITMACPEALQRRFHFDYNLEAKWKKGYHLDVRRALQPTGKPANELFEEDYPLLNGQAVMFVANKMCPAIDSAYELIEAVYAAVVERRDVAKVGIVKQVKTLHDKLKASQPKGRGYRCDREVNLKTDEAERMFRYLLNRDPTLAGEFLEKECDPELADKYLPLLREHTGKSKLWATLTKHCDLFLHGLLLVANLVTLYFQNKKPKRQGPYGGKPTVVKRKIVEAPNLVATESGAPPTDMQQHVLRNVRPISLVCDGKVVSMCCGFGVFGNCYLVPNHMFEETFDTILLGEVSLKKKDYEVINLETGDGVSDAALLHVFKGPRVKDMTMHFRDEVRIPKGTTVAGCVNSHEFGRLVFTGTALTFKDVIVCSDGDELPNVFAYRAATQRGYCGSPVLVKNGAHTVVVGVHSAGGNGNGYASCVTRSVLLKVKKMLDPDVHLEGLIVSTREGEERVHVARKSKLYPTLAHAVFKPEFGPAPLSNNDSRLNPGVVLDNSIFSKHTACVELNYEQSVEFTQACYDYADKLFGVIGRNNGPLTLFEAIKGVDGLDAMEVDTGPGLPWSKDNIRRPALIDFEAGTVSEGIQKRLDEFEMGRFQFECQTFLKDELRPNHKIAVGGTRVVDVLPVEHLIFSRIHLGRFCSHMHLNYGLGIGSAVGCNPDVDWHQFAVQFQPFKNVWAIDYSAFDASHSVDLLSQMIEAVFSDENGFSVHARDVLHSLETTVHAYEDKRYTIKGGLPSGCAATSIINTVLNNIYVLYALRREYPWVTPDDYVMVAYGDDVVIASDHDFDFNKLVARFAELGHKITPEDKSNRGFQLGLKITDVSFLKRQFVFDHYAGFYKPVMSSRTLEAILSYARKGQLEEKLVSVAGLAFHSGEREFKRLFAPFDGLFEFPSYSALRLRWYRAVSQG